MSNHDLKPLLIAALAQIPACDFLGIQSLAASPGRVVISLPKKPELTETTGKFQGGIIGALIDIAGAAACGTLLDRDETLQSLDFTVKLLAPADAEQLVAVAQTVNDQKRSILTAEVSVFNASEDGIIAACGLVSTRVHKR